MAKVILTGFMGTGKTSVGKALARRLGCPFVDTDDLIERAEGRKIEEIFAAEGEEYFRSAERRALIEALTIPNAVVASGGGAVLSAENLSRIRAAGPLVCLTARPEVIRERVGGDVALRPILAKHGLEGIEGLLDQRASAYAKADFTVDTSDRPVGSVVREIAQFLERPASEQGKASA
jgi:shikimate kinase